MTTYKLGGALQARGRGTDLGSTTAEVPKPFVKEVSNEGNPSQRPWYLPGALLYPSLAQVFYAPITSYAAWEMSSESRLK